MTEGNIKENETVLNEEQTDNVNGGGVPGYLQEVKNKGTAPL